MYQRQTLPIYAPEHEHYLKSVPSSYTVAFALTGVELGVLLGEEVPVALPDGAGAAFPVGAATPAGAFEPELGVPGEEVALPDGTALADGAGVALGDALAAGSLDASAPVAGLAAGLATAPWTSKLMNN